PLPLRHARASSRAPSRKPNPLAPRGNARVEPCGGAKPHAIRSPFHKAILPALRAFPQHSLFTDTRRQARRALRVRRLPAHFQRSKMGRQPAANEAGRAMTALTLVRPGGELTQTTAGEASANAVVFDAAAKHAERIKDATALEKALIGKLDAQRAFVA